jgi:hypothetical protein
MILDFNEINKIIINPALSDDFLKEPGTSHYKLLSYLSNQINDATIIDIGTNLGLSSAALATNSTNKIITFDVADKLSSSDKAERWYNNNVNFSTDNILEPGDRYKWKNIILGSSLIFLDIDPCSGVLEYEFYTWLKNNNYKGLLICNSIWHIKGMRDNFWYKIPSSEKYDVTMIGHFGGTGIVSFTGHKFEIYEKAPSRIPKYTSNDKSWTIVTAYFNLTKMVDASTEIKQRDLAYYMTNANMTMALDQNLVVYCDPESLPYLKALRPSYLIDKTKYIVTEFADINIVKTNYERLVSIRQRTGYCADARNTSSYYLFCLTRNELLLKTMEENPFNSTHFAWCNICIERMGWKSGHFFPKIWQEFRDKFSTCYIDYQPKSLAIDNVKEYYRWGRCGMCSGFYTGNKYYLTEVCKEVINTFYQMLDLEVGHADEQLFSIVYFRRPELFDFYYGDYTEMIINYGWIYDRPYEPVRNIIRNLYASKENWALLRDVTSRWLQSHKYGCFSIDDSTLESVKNINNEAKMNCKYII